MRPDPPLVKRGEERPAAGGAASSGGGWQEVVSRQVVRTKCLPLGTGASLLALTHYSLDSPLRKQDPDGIAVFLVGFAQKSGDFLRKSEHPPFS